MKKRSFLPLLGFLFFVILIYLSGQISALSTYTNPLILVSPASAMLVFGVAFAFYYGAFLATGNNGSSLQVFKFRWLQEVLVEAGIIGSLIGITFMAAGVGIAIESDFVLAVGSGMAISLVTTLYGLLGALGFYFIEKRLIVKGEDEQFEPPKVKLGFNLRSIWGLLVFLGLLFGAIFMQGSMIDTNPRPIFFNLPVVFLVATFLLASVFIYGWKTTIQALRVPFWRVNDDEETLLSRLRAIRGSKRIIAILGLTVAAIAPIGTLSVLGGTVSLWRTGAILFWCLLLILYLCLAEGQVVQQIYLQTGKIYHEDRLFIAKLILPSFILFYFSFWIVIIFLFII